MTRDYEREFEKLWLDKLQRQITTPLHNWFTLNSETLSICYIFKGKSHTIMLSQEDALDFLLKQKIISRAAFINGKTRMFIDTVDTTVGANMEPIQKPVSRYLPWSSISFTKEDVIHLAVLIEYEKMGVVFNAAKVVHFYPMTQQAA